MAGVFDYVLVCGNISICSVPSDSLWPQGLQFSTSSIHEIFQAVSYKYLTHDVLKNVYILSVIHCFVFNSCTHSHLLTHWLHILLSLKQFHIYVGLDWSYSTRYITASFINKRSIPAQLSAHCSICPLSIRLQFTEAV